MQGQQPPPYPTFTSQPTYGPPVQQIVMASNRKETSLNTFNDIKSRVYSENMLKDQ